MGKERVIGVSADIVGRRFESKFRADETPLRKFVFDGTKLSQLRPPT